jgi:hypothetical protein
MRVKELPDDDREKAHAYLREAGCNPAEIDDLTMDEMSLFLQAWGEDVERKCERDRHVWQLEEELQTLLYPVEVKHPGLPIYKAVWFLPQAEQQRVYAILREQNQLARPVLVTRDRQPWHAAVERMIQIEQDLDFTREDGVGRLRVASEEDLDARIDQTAQRVLKQDSTWPPGLVRRYVEQILSTLCGLPR